MMKHIIIKNFHPMTAVDCTLLQTLVQSHRQSWLNYMLYDQHTDVCAALAAFAKHEMYHTTKQKKIMKKCMPPEVWPAFLAEFDCPTFPHRHQITVELQTTPTIIGGKFAFDLVLVRSDLYLQTCAGADLIRKLLRGILWERAPQSIEIV